jgi:hypothetical protein
MQATISLQEAQFWMNTYRDLLAVDENALQKMRDLVIARADSPDDYEPLPAHQLDSVFRIDPTSDVGLGGSREYERE